MECRICGGREIARRFEVREMMFGTRERFPYCECASCGCLQIERIPKHLSSFYPGDGYYAFRLQPSAGGVRKLLREHRNRYAISGTGTVGRLLHALMPHPLGNVHQWFRHAPVTAETRILDVGCGSGALLRDLAGAGLQRLLGIDPFLDRESHLENDLRLEKKTIHQVAGEFDVVMFHHSLEHIPDQLGTLRAAAGLLAPGGRCLIRLPVVPCDAWEHYGTDWVQLDAPRHVVIHSRHSLHRAAAEAGLQPIDSWCDSTELQFVGSELYRRDIPLVEREGRFSKREIRSYRKRARELNASGRGDQAVFVFTRG